MPSSVLVSISNSHFYLHAFTCSSINSMFCFIVYYAMLVRLVLYMFSYLSTHVLCGSYFCVLTMFRTNMYALDLMHIHLHYDHLDVYDYMMICFDDSCFSMIFAMFIRLMLYMISD